MKIEWRGNSHTNKSSRDGIKPIAIVDHVVAGSGQSCDNWFRSSGNNVSSAHFNVWEDGRITQYVDIRDMAWAAGLTRDRIPYATASIVKARPNTNPNKYTINIEHAGHTGKLTPAQFEATVFLHKWIRDEVKRIYGIEIPLNRTHVIGHYEVDPKRKPNCPGPDFPWSNLMKALSGSTAVAKPSPSNNVLDKGDSGASVKDLQNKLLKVGIKLPKYGADGDYGDETVIAVKQFQQKYGLQVDGIAGPQTLAKLDDLLKPKAPVATNEIGEITVLVGQLNVRAQADFGSTIVDVLEKGEKRKVYAEKNGLYHLGGNEWTSAGAKYVKFTKKAEPKPAPKPAPKKVLHRVQVGAFSKESGAKTLEKELQKKGYQTLIKKEGKLYKVQTGAFSSKANAESLAAKLKKDGYKTFITD
jgi:N-acetylmuramoyl-L-alanine amidase